MSSAAVVIGALRVNLSEIFRVNMVANLVGLLLCITKTYLYNFNPLKPHLYIVKLGFTGVYIICLILLKKT